MSAHSWRCATILCACGHYHPTDGTVVVCRSDGTPLYRFAQAQEQIECGDEPCDIVAQHALSDVEVDDVQAQS